MSNDNGKVHTVHIALANMANMSASTKTSTASGLESIANTLVALQSLQQEQVKKVDEKETAAAVTTTTTTVLHPPLPTMKLATRVVSTETMIGDNHSVDEHLSSNNTPNSCFPPLPPRVEEREAISSSSKAKNAATSPPSTDINISSFLCWPSPSQSAPSPPSSNTTAKDIPPPDFSRILSDPEAWLRKTENLFGKLPPTERGSSNSIVVQPNDVLCGRGGETNHHPGNVRYRSLVKAYQKLYLLAKRRDKPKIAQCIVVSVRGVDGRFLKRVKNANKTGAPAWVDVGNVKAREKTSQALREGAPDLRENATTPTKTTSSDNAAIDGRQLPALDIRENATVPPTTTTTTLSSTMPTALEAMMGWRMSTASFNSAKSTRNANGSTSPVPPTSSSSPSPSTKSSMPPSDTDTDTLTAQAFAVAASKLMQHPIFHKLDPGQQQQAILHELKVAKASASAAATTAEMATRTSASTATAMPANIHGQGRTSPMMTSTSMQQQQPPHSQHQHQQRYPPHEHPYYHHGQYHHYPHPYGRYAHDGNMNNNKDPTNTDTTATPAPSLPSSNVPPPQTVGNVDLQSMYRDLLRAKAALASGGCNVIDPAYDNGNGNGNGNDETRMATDTTIAPLRNIKKRSAPCNDVETSVENITAKLLHNFKNRPEHSSSASSLVPSMASMVAPPPLSSATCSLLMGSPTVVSDAGSEVSSSLSSITSGSSFNASNNNINNNVIMKNKDAVVTEVSRGGSRLKRLKLRIQDEADEVY